MPEGMVPYRNATGVRARIGGRLLVLVAMILPLNFTLGFISMASGVRTRMIALGVLLLPMTAVCWWTFSRMRSVPYVVDSRTITRRSWPRRSIDWRTVTDVSLYTYLLTPIQRLVIVYEPDGARRRPRYLALYPQLLAPPPEDLRDFLLRRHRHARGR